MNAIFARITEHHDAIALTLTPCAGLLYRWLLRQRPAGQQQEVEIAEFAAWTGTERSRPYCLKHIKNALSELIEAGLVEIVRQYTSKIFKLIAWHPDRQKSSQAKQFTSQNGKPISQKQTSNTDNSVASYRETQRTTNNPPTHPANVKSYEQGKVDRSSGLASVALQEISLGFTTELNPPTSSSLKATARPEVEVLQNEAETVAPTPQSSTEISSNSSDTEPITADPSNQQKTLEAIEATGIVLNPRLTSIVQKASRQVVQAALMLLQSRQQQGKVKNPAGFLVEAIRRGWKLPAANHDNRTAATQLNNAQPQRSVPPGFNEWYALAYRFGIVRGSTQLNGELHVYTDLEQWQPWREMKTLFSTQRLQEMVDRVGSP